MSIILNSWREQIEGHEMLVIHSTEGYTASLPNSKGGPIVSATTLKELRTVFRDGLHIYLCVQTLIGFQHWVKSLDYLKDEV